MPKTLKLLKVLIVMLCKIAILIVAYPYKIVNNTCIYLILNLLEKHILFPNRLRQNIINIVCFNKLIQTDDVIDTQNGS